MNPIIDKMLTVTADIAENLLSAKDSGASFLDADTKLLIIQLAELASNLPDKDEETGGETETSKISEVHIPEVAETTPAEEPESYITQEEQHGQGYEYEEEESEEQENEEQEPETDFQEPTPTAEAVDLSLWRQLFSINDMFLFRRELFNGSETLFNTALGEIGQSRSVDEVRLVLTDRYGIDLRQKTAKEFLSVISTVFE